MATKTAAKKSTTTTRRKAAPASTAKSSVSSTKIIHSVASAKTLDAKTQQKRFMCLYIFFAVATVVFACISIYLFKSNVDLMNKYEAIEDCVRAGTKCDIKVEDSIDNIDAGLEPVTE